MSKISDLYPELTIEVISENAVGNWNRCTARHFRITSKNRLTRKQIRVLHENDLLPGGGQEITNVSQCDGLEKILEEGQPSAHYEYTCSTVVYSDD